MHCPTYDCLCIRNLTFNCVCAEAHGALVCSLLLLGNFLEEIILVVVDDAD